ncbi:MAG: cbb3-type cytochrome oxidase assembly protein CcoS [Paracoccus sp. (in: a-proteobacteria)]|uniref:cbb3-type cytochrome oxidase assembly protein CcoS n=1 Tax=Paracoccus sp. TaxID=267 RepID=UPI004057DA7B
MTILYLLIPITLVMGVIGLGAFFWSLRSSQYDDLAGDAERILHDDGDTPLVPNKETPR